MKKIYIFVSVILFLFVLSVPAQAYNNGWVYKKPIIINNSQNPNSLFDYQLLLNVSYKAGMKSDFSDLRFSWFNASSGAEVPVSYFLENYTSGLFSDVWINAPKISAGGHETVYMYYGNSSAVSESNSNTTFDLYDDFEGTVLDTDKWDVIENASVSGGEARLYGLAWIVSKEAFGEQIIKEARNRRGGNSGGLYLSLRDNTMTNYIDEGTGEDSTPWRWDTYNGISPHGGYNGKNDNYYHTWKLERNGTAYVKIYQDEVFFINATDDLPSGNLKIGFKGGEYGGSSSYTFIDWVRIRKYADSEPTYYFSDAASNSGLKISINVPEKIQANGTFSLDIKIVNNSINPITNLSSSYFKLFRDSGQINFTDFRNFQNGTYSLNASSGNTIGNVSFRVEAGGASAEAFAKVWVKPKANSVFIADIWESTFSAGLTGKPVFANYSETEKYYFGKIRPEQVFVFENITTGYTAYRFKNKQAFLEAFYTNETAITVSNKEQALAAAPYARLKNYPIVFDDEMNGFSSIVNLSAKTAGEISDITIKEFPKYGKNINTIVITNLNSETSALAGALAAKHNSIIIPLNFSSISYPYSVSDFYGLNSGNGVLKIQQKINTTIKKLSDSFLFSNSIDYKIGKMQLNLILLGNASEVPQPVIFDSGREALFDYDSNYLLSDFPYADINNDGKADLIAGRIVSEYQLLDLPKNNNVVTAALYRNLETVFSSNGLIESQTTDAAFRTAGFETIRLVENRTNLSYYELTFGLSNITDFLKRLFEEQSITGSIKLLGNIYGSYNEFLEHNYYKMMSSMSIGWEGLTLRMIPDERLAKEPLLSGMQNADGIFYYGNGGKDFWQLESFGSDKILFNEFPPTGAALYDEHTNSARLPDKTVFGKGISAFIGSSGIIYDVYSFMPNAKFAQSIARNKSIAASLENSKYPLLPSQIRNLTAALSFSYLPERDLAIKQFLQMVCYCDPEKKIDPDAQEQGSNPAINHSTTFVSRIRIPINYIATENRLFFDAKDYLQEMGKPVIPLYSSETVLPNGSKIVGIRFNYNITRYENITVDFVPAYEQFNETVGQIHGFYPQQMFYNETFDLLDGRKSVKIIAAGMQYNNDTKDALVVDDAEAVIEYFSPFEFVSFFAENITAGKNQTFKINVFGTQNLSVVIDIRSGNFSETITKNIPSGYSEIIWIPPFSGSFATTAYVLMGNNSAGPRYAYFSVSNKAGFFSIFESFGTSGYNKVMKNFAEKIQFAFNEASAFLGQISPLSKFSSSANSSRIEKHISDSEYSLSVSQDSGKVVYKIKSDKGELVLEKNSGATKEACRGDCAGLYEKMSPKLAEMQDAQDYVIDIIR